MATLTKRINQSNKVITNRINNINNGGCGIYAKALYDVVHKQYPDLDVKFVIIAKSFAIDTLNEKLSSKSTTKSLGDWYHILTVIDGKYIDAYRNTKSIKTHLIHFKGDFNITSEFGIDILRKVFKDTKWNPSFDQKNKGKIKYSLKTNINIK